MDAAKSLKVNLARAGQANPNAGRPTNELSSPVRDLGTSPEGEHRSNGQRTSPIGVADFSI
jgi:hypothetical protein